MMTMMKTVRSSSVPKCNFSVKSIGNGTKGGWNPPQGSLGQDNLQGSQVHHSRPELYSIRWK